MWIKLISIKSSFNDQKHKKKTVTARDEKRNKIVFKKMSIKKQNERTLIWMLVELKKERKHTEDMRDAVNNNKQHIKTVFKVFEQM